MCSTPGCPTIHPGTGRCPECAAKADKARGTATERGYNSRGHQSFRRQVLARDPVCTQCHAAYATVADHYPLSRRELIEQGLDPNNPDAGRGLCKPCHDRHTAQAQPGGWHAPTDC